MAVLCTVLRPVAGPPSCPGPAAARGPPIAEPRTIAFALVPTRRFGVNGLFPRALAGCSERRRSALLRASGPAARGVGADARRGEAARAAFRPFAPSPLLGPV